MTRVNIGYSDLWKMPVRYRHWFVERLIKTTAAPNTTTTGGIELDDDTPISQVLGKRNK